VILLILPQNSRISRFPEPIYTNNSWVDSSYFSACVSVQPNDNGEYVLSESVSANVFKALLDYYTTGSIRCPLGVSVSELRESCDYFMIPFNSEIVKCDNLAELMHELSNQGARDEFNSLLEHLIVPTLVKATHRGEREIRLGRGNYLIRYQIFFHSLAV